MHACIQSIAPQGRNGKVLENEHVVATICWHPTTLLDLTQPKPARFNIIEVLFFYLRDPPMLADLTIEFMLFWSESITLFDTCVNYGEN